MLPSINPSETQAWQKLREHFAEIQYTTMQEMFQEDTNRAEKFHIVWDQFLIDYSKNRIDQKTMSLLLELANEVGLKEAIDAQFSGGLINQTEGRAVLHTALRAKKSDVVKVNGVNIIPEVFQVKEKMELFTNEVVSGRRKGFTGKPFTDVVNIGIGGSDLGPAMIVEALQFYKNHLNIHFVSNIDGDHVQETIKN